MAEPTLDQIRRRLAQLNPLELQVEDESSRHVGHPGAARGGGHFRLRVVSAAFDGLSRLQRHRLVYDCLDILMPREIHALAMTLLSPEEAASAQSHPPPRE
jgi:BolA protein